MRIRGGFVAGLAATLLLTAAAARGQAAEAPAPPAEAEEEGWSYGASLYAYFLRRAPYGQPTFTADRGWFHAEARYNYEDRDTASLWAGYNLAFGEDVAVEFTPMLGAVFGETDGVAPGYKLSIAWWKLELYSEGEYVFDSGDSSDDYFFTWNELTISPWDWLRVGLVAQRTRVYESELDIERGILVGFTRDEAALTVHVFDPDRGDPTTVVSLAISF